MTFDQADKQNLTLRLRQTRSAISTAPGKPYPLPQEFFLGLTEPPTACALSPSALVPTSSIRVLSPSRAIALPLRKT